MALGADRYASRADALVFIACVVLSVAAMGLPESWRQPIARGLRATVLAPFLYLQQQSEELRTSRARYDQVVAQRDSTALAAGFAPELRNENARLRGLLGLGQRLSGGCGAAEGWERTYLLRPAVHPAAVTHVMVLTGPVARSGDLHAAFTAMGEAP